MEFRSNLFWCIVGIIGGAVSSFLISLFFYLKGFKSKKILYSEKHSILYNGETCSIIFPTTDGRIVRRFYLALYADARYNMSVERLCRYDIEIFRFKITGKEVIHMEDFAHAVPFQIRTSDNYAPEISSLTVRMESSNRNNTLTPTFENNTMRINFDYLSKGETITIFILHQSGMAHVEGVLKNGKISGIGSSFILHFIWTILKGVLLSLGICCVLYFITSLIYYYLYYETDLLESIESIYALWEAFGYRKSVLREVFQYRRFYKL